LFTEHLEIDHNTQICFNHDSGLSFFPVDNTGGSGEENIQAGQASMDVFSGFTVGTRGTLHEP